MWTGVILTNPRSTLCALPPLLPVERRDSNMVSRLVPSLPLRRASPGLRPASSSSSVRPDRSVQLLPAGDTASRGGTRPTHLDANTMRGEWPLTQRAWSETREQVMRSGTGWLGAVLRSARALRRAAQKRVVTACSRWWACLRT